MVRNSCPRISSRHCQRNVDLLYAFEGKVGVGRLDSLLIYFLPGAELVQVVVVNINGLSPPEFSRVSKKGGRKNTKDGQSFVLV